MANPFTTTGPDGVDPGITTTEFWVAVVTEVLTLVDVFQIHHFNQQQDAAIMAAIPMVYILARSLVKAAAQLRQHPLVVPITGPPVTPPTP